VDDARSASIHSECALSLGVKVHSSSSLAACTPRSWRRSASRLEAHLSHRRARPALLRVTLTRDRQYFARASSPSSAVATAAGCAPRTLAAGGCVAAPSCGAPSRAPSPLASPTTAAPSNALPGAPSPSHAEKREQLSACSPRSRVGVGVGGGGGVGGGVHGSRRPWRQRGAGLQARSRRRACSSGLAQSRAAAGPDARVPWTVAHSQPTCSKVSHLQLPCSKASSCASTPGLPRLLGGQASSSLRSGTAASAASVAAAASASTESAAAAVAGKEEQDAIEDAAGSSSGGSETDRLVPVRCGAVGSVQVTEAAHPSPSADHSKRSMQGIVGWALAGQAARDV